MKFQEKKAERIYKGFFEFIKLKVQFETYKGEFKESNVECFHRGDSSCILLNQSETKELLLVEQFRYPTTYYDSGWLIELVAGSIDKNETPEKSIKREIEEEIGYEVKEVCKIGHYYLSPGGTTERIFIFYAEVNQTDKTRSGGGKIGESEDIKLIKLKHSEVEIQIKENKIIDAKTIIALQWFQKNKT